MIDLLIIALLSYVAGSFPTAIIVGKLTKGIDIREHGSGNAGGTNVFRVLGWKLGVFVMLVDMLKGFLATTFLSQISFTGDAASFDPVYLKMTAGVFAIVGHIWTVFAGFRGGKGVGTAAGFLLGLAPQAVLVGFIVFFVIFLSTRYVSLSSMIASACIPLTLIMQKFVVNTEVPWILIILTLSISALIIFTHRSNIVRLLNGTENKISNLKGGNAK